VELPKFKKEQQEQVRPEVPVILADPAVGLTEQQARERADSGYANVAIESSSKTVGQIILSNTLTYFNLIFFVLAALLIAVGSWVNLTFLPVVFANTIIGIVQELRSKRTLDKLSILNSPKGVVIRDGVQRTQSVNDMVRDDIVIFAAGNQIFSDAEVVEGECLVNEALITGEADEIKKRPGDELLSGSFVVSGSCRARLTAVGADSFVSKLTLEAKKSKKPKTSEMMNSLSKLVMWIGIILIPLGILMCVKEVAWLDRSFSEGIVSTVAALVGMIPEGLYLLTSVALVASVVRLAQKKTLVHEMGCIETLARVDTLCVDKTGTITENKMIVEDICLLCEDRFIEDDIRMIMADYVYAMQADNDTMAALRKYFSGTVNQKAIATLPFSSAKKYGGVSFHEDETYILGAPDVILGGEYDRYRDKIEHYSARGCRVLLLAMYDGSLEDEVLSQEKMPIALILLSNKIRPEAPDTFRFFAEQGVAVKVISGDNAITVSEVAKRAGIENAEQYIDARELDTDKKLREAANEYTVFGRVTPEQKKKLVLAMHSAGHTVAMTGDGVNDVLALKAADCSIAMASGSDVAAQVSHIVLLNSDFSSMPSVVMEGRRVINNIERSASLFLVKNIFSFVLALISLFFTLTYPFTPSQLSLVSTITIGIPSFVLALEPNESRVKGKFLKNVMYRALPAAITDLVLILGVILFNIAFKIGDNETSTICTVVMGVVGLMMVFKTCQPFNKLRRAMMIVLTAAFGFCVLFMRTLFTLSELSFSHMLILVVISLLAWPGLNLATRSLDGLRDTSFRLFSRKSRKH
jgi:cation-transporting ATPase E